MLFGLALPQYGDFADGSSTMTVAAGAEAAGVASLWASDRLLVATSPRDLYPRFGGATDVPASYRVFLDPLTTLAAAAAVTSNVRLGTDVLVAPWYPPALLARSLATLDRISGGRVDIGLGIGWSADEYQAAGIPKSDRGARLDEALAALEALWSSDPAAHQGKYWTIPSSYPGVRPAKGRRPQIYLSAFSEPALRRVAAQADGWLPADLPIWLLEQLWSRLRAYAAECDRDPGTLRFLVRICPTGDEQSPVGKTAAELADYLRSAADIGVQECIVDLQQISRSPAEILELAKLLIEKL
jgi:probable F420-dependent oxidoreductase